jgi:hypothetical protein
LPKGKAFILAKWVHKVKKRSKRRSSHFEAKACCMQFLKKVGIDYEETFCPIVK